MTDYVPAGVSFDLNYSSTSGNSSDYRIQMRDITLDQVEEYITAAENFGYTETHRGTMEGADCDTLLYEATMIVDEELDIPLYLQIAWYDGKVMISFCDSYYVKTEEALWEYAINYDGTAETPRISCIPRWICWMPWWRKPTAAPSTV